MDGSICSEGAASWTPHRYSAHFVILRHSRRISKGASRVTSDPMFEILHFVQDDKVRSVMAVNPFPRGRASQAPTPTKAKKHAPYRTAGSSKRSRCGTSKQVPYRLSHINVRVHSLHCFSFFTANPLRSLCGECCRDSPTDCCATGLLKLLLPPKQKDRYAPIVL